MKFYSSGATLSRKNLRDLYVSYHHEKNKYGRKSGGSDRVQLTNECIGTGKKVLDLGCRDGSLTKFIMDGNDVTGVDIDDIALSMCSENLGIKTMHIDLNDDFPFYDGEFDVVNAGELIEHMVIPQHFVRESRRVLKEGGLFCGTTPNAYRLLTKFEFLLGKPLCGDPTHLHYFSYDTLNSLLKDHFREVKIVPYHGHIIGSHKFGISVKRTSSVIVGKLFSRHFFWQAVK